MYELLQSVRTYLRMAWLYRWLGISFALIASLAGWTYVYTMPDQYQVSAKLYLDSSSMLKPLLKGLAFNSNMLRDTALMLERTLLTRPNLEDIARRADMDLEAQTPEEFDDIVSDLGRRVSIVKTKRENIYDIKFTDIDPARAKVVIDEILNTLLESSLGSSRKETAVTQRFLDEQIAEYETRLIAAEEKVKEFKQRNIGVMPGSQGGYFERLQIAHTDLKNATLELEEATRRYAQLKETGTGATPSFGGGDLFSSGFGEFDDGALSSPELTEIDGRIANYDAIIDELLLIYTEKYPDVVVYRQRIADLEVKREKEMERIAQEALDRPAEVDSGPVTDPYQQQLKLQIADAGSIVAGLQTRVKEFQNRVTDLERKVDIVPEVEAELARLNRDYSINKSQFDQLMVRREQAYLSQEADQAQDDVKIRIIDPPRVPFGPSGPNRMLFLSVVLLLAITLGGALSFVMSQLNPRVIDITDLKEFTGLPILGSIGMTQSVSHRRQRRTELAAFSMGLLFLFASYVTQIALYQQGIAIHEKVASLLGAFI